jgi:hypothetical protein
MKNLVLSIVLLSSVVTTHAAPAGGLPPHVCNGPAGAHNPNCGTKPPQMPSVPIVNLPSVPVPPVVTPPVVINPPTVQPPVSGNPPTVQPPVSGNPPTVSLPTIPSTSSVKSLGGAMPIEGWPGAQRVVFSFEALYSQFSGDKDYKYYNSNGSSYSSKTPKFDVLIDYLRYNQYIYSTNIVGVYRY